MQREIHAQPLAHAPQEGQAERQAEFHRADMRAIDRDRLHATEAQPRHAAFQAKDGAALPVRRHHRGAEGRQVVAEAAGLVDAQVGCRGRAVELELLHPHALAAQRRLHRRGERQ